MFELTFFVAGFFLLSYLEEKKRRKTTTACAFMWFNKWLFLLSWMPENTHWQILISLKWMKKPPNQNVHSINIYWTLPNEANQSMYKCFRYRLKWLNNFVNVISNYTGVCHSLCMFLYLKKRKSVFWLLSNIFRIAI